MEHALTAISGVDDVFFNFPCAKAFWALAFQLASCSAVRYLLYWIRLVSDQKWNLMAELRPCCEDCYTIMRWHPL
jgi:hypothetical protein